MQHFRGKWYEFHKVPRKIKSRYKFKNLIYNRKLTQEITAEDFTNLGFGNIDDLGGHDFSSMVYNFKTKTMKAVEYGRKYKFFCSHKLRNQQGKFESISLVLCVQDFGHRKNFISGGTCPGKTHECNDRGTCNSGVCTCFTGYIGDRCTLESTSGSGSGAGAGGGSGEANIETPCKMSQLQSKIWM